MGRTAMDRDRDTDEAVDVELAFARLAWVQASGCVQLPSQREALDWHQACCDAALEAMHDRQAQRAEE